LEKNANFGDTLTGLCQVRVSPALPGFVITQGSAFARVLLASPGWYWLHQGGSGFTMIVLALPGLITASFSFTVLTKYFQLKKDEANLSGLPKATFD
jgi:hypothetical protein